jgi:hypothetical protein
LSPTNKVAEAKGIFPAAKDYSYTIPEKTGHSANLHYSSPGSFEEIHSYLAGQGYRWKHGIVQMLMEKLWVKITVRGTELLSIEPRGITTITMLLPPTVASLA